MNKKMNFSVKILKKERFLEIGTPISEERKASIISELERKYGGQIDFIEASVHIYTPTLTRNGEQRHRFKLLKDFLNSFVHSLKTHFYRL